MKRLLALCLLIASAMGCTAVVSGPASGPAGMPASAPAGIPTVKTTQQLVGLPPVATYGGWEIRLGLADAGDLAGPALLLYSYEKHPDKESAGRPFRPCPGQPVGMASYFLTKAGQVPKIAKQPTQLMRINHDTEFLSCALVPLDEKGRFDLTVVDPDGRIIARRSFEVKEPQPWYWHRFLASPQGTDNGRPKQEKQPTDEARPYQCDVEGWSAVPIYDGSEPVWRQYGNGLQSAMPRDLPGRLIERGDRPRSSALEYGMLDVSLEYDEPEDPETIPNGVMARWWLNGKPVPAAGGAEREPRLLRKMSRQAPSIAHGGLGAMLRLPKTMKGVNVGDKVRLQLLYCPATAGSIEVDNAEVKTVDTEIGFLPRLLENVEFTVTDELLKASTRPAAE